MATATQALSRQEVQEAFEQLRREVVSGNEDAVTEYLTELAELAANAHRVDGTFRRWSHRNYLMIESQRRRFDETHRGLYAGVAQWRRIGRAVRTDARPKLIWAAMGSRSEDESVSQTPLVPQGATEAQTAVAATATKRKVKAAKPRSGFSGFRLVEVYDWTDTVATDPDDVEPDWHAPLIGGDRETLDALVDSAPFKIVFDRLGGRESHLQRTATKVTVEEDLPVGNRIALVCRALALTQIEADSTVPESDRDAEATVAVVLASKMLGLDTDGAVTSSAATYLRYFAEPDGSQITGIKRQLKLLNGRLDRAMTVANSIVSAARTT